MTVLTAQVTIPVDSAIPADAIVNTWHFSTDDVAAAGDYTAVATRLGAFYDSLDSVIANSVNPALARLKIYHVGDAENAPPHYDEAFPWTGGTDDPLPHEVSLCLSYSAGFMSGVPMARTRGRIFIGPIGRGTQDPSNRSRPYIDAITALATAGDALATANTAGLKWVVFSPTIYAITPATDWADFGVTEGWVDNAYDTQRRRGQKATSRVSWAA